MSIAMDDPSPNMIFYCGKDNDRILWAGEEGRIKGTKVASIEQIQKLKIH
jgi:hypothetical protein